MSQHILRNIIYFCTPENRPTGGIKYLLRHSHLINGMANHNIASAIHVLSFPDFVPTWEVPFVHKRENRFNPLTDLIVLPEILVAQTAPTLLKMGVRYAILLQNGFYIIRGKTTRESQEPLYAGALGIVSTSDEITSTVRALFPRIETPIFEVNYAFDAKTFSGHAEKRDLITYMPRKLGEHGHRVLEFLSARDLRGWTVQPIDGLNEAGVVELLKASRIFLSFSHMEGFGLPPVEAALLGNKVIGYTGIGGREFWKPPIFEEIEYSDFSAFATAIEREIAQQTEHPERNAAFELQIAELAERYSTANELARLEAFVQAAIAAFAKD
jgi:hypothetical protein